MHPKYCSECAEIHADRCPRRIEYWADHGGWSTDLKQTDLPKVGGYPKYAGFITQRNQQLGYPKYVDNYDAGEPNCKIHSASLIFSRIKGGGAGGSHPIDRETFTIRRHDELRLRSMYAYTRGELKTTGIPTIDKANACPVCGVIGKHVCQLYKC